MNETVGTRYLSFSLGAEEYAIPLLCVKEVIAIPEVTPVPFSPPHFQGIMNLRGQVISIIDLRTKLGIKSNKATENAVIICDLDRLCLGVIVDSINAVHAPAASDLSARPDMQSTKASDYIMQVYRKENKLILLLDIAKALSVDDFKVIEKNGEKTRKAA